VIFGILGGGILLYRSKEIKGSATSSDWLSTEFFVFGNILGMVVSAFLVLIGMSSPLLTRWFGTPASVQSAYYDISITPLAILVVFLLALFPALSWGSNHKANLWRGIRFPLVLSVLITVVVVVARIRQPLFIIFIFMATFAFLSNGRVVLDRLRNGKIAGAFLAHAGLALLLLGVIFSNVYESRTRLSLRPGIPQEAFGYTFNYQGKDEVSPQGKTPHKILVQRGSHSFVAAPKQYFSAYNQGIMRTPYIKRYWNKDLYVAPIEEVDHSVTEQAFILQKGEQSEVKGYSFRFTEFKISEHQRGADQEVAAVLEVTFKDEIETITPKLIADGRGLRQEPARFNHDRALVYLEGVQADQGGVALRVVGQSANTEEVPQPGFAIEVSVKPFINLLWGGSILVVLGGLVSLKSRWKALSQMKRQKTVEPEATKPEPLREEVTA
jgi:cytochrome c-type biogenesis protein CcmF